MSLNKSPVGVANGGAAANAAVAAPVPMPETKSALTMSTATGSATTPKKKVAKSKVAKTSRVGVIAVLRGDIVEDAAATPLAVKKGPNFTALELEILMKAWVHASTDPIKGNYQGSIAFWGHVSTHYNGCPEYKGKNLKATDGLFVKR